MKKTLTAIALGLSIIGNAMAVEKHDKWIEINGAFYSPFVGTTDGGVSFATLYENKMGNIVASIDFLNGSVTESDCKNAELGKYNNTQPLNINGTLVKTTYGCVDKDRVKFFPITNAGQNHIISVFKASNTVTVSGDFTYSANGFTKSYNTLKARNDKKKLAI
ncbi:hypothetical protein [Photobacterium indicum]|uniref:Uncharacterized protein n=1 Tax=Photobacterium indicum TaxID=81447 RepID=A0A2T3L3E3_9GAMM|nr:hypothetical protein [Photobacterium indicum]PSV43616.1 hypothetical protein C9J47_22370 [Photobacterium indicum]